MITQEQDIARSIWTEICAGLSWPIEEEKVVVGGRVLRFRTVAACLSAEEEGEEKREAAL